MKHSESPPCFLTLHWAQCSVYSPAFPKCEGSLLDEGLADFQNVAGAWVPDQLCFCTCRSQRPVSGGDALMGEDAV
jgi:hypothetical protein